MPDWRRLTVIGAGLATLCAGLGLSAPLGALPDAASEQVAAARDAVRRGDGIAAEGALRKAMAAGASRTDIAARMGEAMLLQGDLHRAREWLQPGQFAPADQALGWQMLGRLLRREGKLPEAGQAFDQALRRAPQDPLLWVDIARLRWVGGEHIQAIQAADRALAFGPAEPRALELHAQMLRDRSGPVAAATALEQALDAAPDDTALQLELAASLGDAGRASEALAVTRQVQAAIPRNPFPYFFQAVIAARAGNVDLAQKLMSRTRGQLNSVPAAVMLQGALELEAGNPTVAVETLERLDRIQPANREVQQLYARALFAVGDFTRLHQRFDALAARGDAPVYLLTLLGRAYEVQGNRAAAAALLDRAAAAGSAPVMPIPEEASPAMLAARWRDAPADPAATVPYVRGLLGGGNLAAAEQATARFRALRPGSVDALVLSGDTALLRRDYASAFAAYDQAARVRFPDWLMLRATDALAGAGRGGDAAQIVARYAAAFPASHLGQRMLAGNAAFAGDWELARQLLENLNLRTGQRDVRLIADLSLAQLRDGDARAALNSADAALRLQRASPVAAQARAMALAALGQDKRQAEALIAKTRRMAGDNPLLAEARKQLAR